MKNAEYIADKLLMAGRRLGYRNRNGEVRGQKHYDFNLQNIDDVKLELIDCFEEGIYDDEIKAAV